MDARATSHRIEGLDLLRGLAILLVLIRHSWPEFLGGGGLVGVVIFFTLSGYLITGLLLSDIRKYGQVRYGRFYRNRAIRLLPALLFLLIGFVVAEGIINVSGTRDSVLRSILVSVTYTMNIPGFDHGSPNLSHLWTLANEEQFYLLWPLVLAIGIRYRKLRGAVIVTAVLLLAALFGSVAIAGSEVERLYSLPTTWTISMVVGAAAQIGQQRINGWLRGSRRGVGAAIGIVGLLALSLIPDVKSSIPFYLGGGVVIGVLTVLVIWWLRDIPVVSLGAKPLLWLGTVSYAAYLWNYPITWWLRDGDVEFAAPLAVVLTLFMAAVSWFAVERPANRLKARLDARARQPEDDPVFAGSNQQS